MILAYRRSARTNEKDNLSPSQRQRDPHKHLLTTTFGLVKLVRFFIGC